MAFSSVFPPYIYAFFRADGMEKEKGKRRCPAGSVAAEYLVVLVYMQDRGKTL